MSRREVNIDDLFREKLSGAEVIPGSSLRQSLFRKVAVREFLRFNPARFNIYYTAASVAVITASVMLITGRNSSETGGRDNIIKENIMPSDTVTLIHSVPLQKNEALQNTVNKRGLQSQSDKVKSGVQPGGSDIYHSKPVAHDTIRKMNPAVYLNSTGEAGRVRTNPSASFRLPVTEGCAPLKIKIRNTSAPFDSCLWSFGEGGTSRDPEPEWTFETPGIYKIVLKVFSNNGMSSSFSGQVSVWPWPEARFEMVTVEDASDYYEVRFPNYSAGAVRYRWDFGDGSSSSAPEPVHRYQKQGKYTVKLTAWSDKGCESVSEEVITIVSKRQYISFPNAFMPNPTGPTGGYYTAASDASARIFHPESAGVAEYRLRIYTRSGLLLFESNDVNIGWDGYHKGSLCEPGVYLWKATGKFRNGDGFSKMGDVTLIKVNN